MSLSKFNKCAGKSNGYIKFDNLTAGSYPVKHFSIMKKSNFGGKRLLIHLKDGYLILPQRMSEEFATQSEVNKLNKGRYKIVYIGKDKSKRDRVDFRLEKNDEDSSESEEEEDEEEESHDDVDDEKDEPSQKKAKKM